MGDVQGSSRVSEFSGDTEASTGNSQAHGESSYGAVAGWIVTKCSYVGFGFWGAGFREDRSTATCSPVGRLENHESSIAL